MSTVMKKQTDPLVPPPAKQPRDDKQLWYDRWTVLIAVTVVVIMMALLIWVASLGGSVASEVVDYWHMIP